MLLKLKPTYVNLISMNKVPMQIYLDPYLVKEYKRRARRAGTSFANQIRTTLNIGLKKSVKKMPEKITLSQKAMRDFIKEAEKKFVHVKDHHPEKSDDELIYGK